MKKNNSKNINLLFYSGNFDKMYKVLETLSLVNVEVSLEAYESNLY